MKRVIRIAFACSLLAAFTAAGAADSSSSSLSHCFSEPSVGVQGFLNDLPWRLSCAFNELVSM